MKIWIQFYDKDDKHTPFLRYVHSHTGAYALAHVINTIFLEVVFIYDV